MIPGKEWLTVPQAARMMDMSRQGALKRLKRLSARVDGRLLHRGSKGEPWLVSVVVLSELAKIHERDFAVEGIKGRLDDVELKLLALRNSHGKFRRVANGRLDHHERLLKSLHQTNKVTEKIFAEGPNAGNQGKRREPEKHL